MKRTKKQPLFVVTYYPDIEVETRKLTSLRKFSCFVIFDSKIVSHDYH